MKLTKGDIVFVKAGRYSSGPFPFDDWHKLGYNSTHLLDINQIGEIIRDNVWANNPAWPNKPYYVVKVDNTYYVCYDCDILELFTN